MPENTVRKSGGRRDNDDGGARWVAGAMSGTSADGVDVAVVRVTGRGTAMTATLAAHVHRPFDAGLRRAIFALRSDEPINGRGAVALLARVGRDVSLAYAAAVSDALAAAGVGPDELAAVAAHGQTLHHAPPDTVQWIDPALLAATVGCAVVSDFRRADCAAGGQGAPLVPFADYVLFRDAATNRVLLNIGGIANLTHLPADGGLGRVTAFDTGPGNCVSDWLCRTRVDPAGPGYDAGGAIAATGVPIYPIVERMLAEAYFAQPPPKSTDGPAMIEAFSLAVNATGRNYPPDYLLRTACLLTATTIADAIRRWCDPFPDEVIVSGGGAHNATLMHLLRQPLGGVSIRTTDELGVPGAAKEAIAFALLGAATLDGEPSNVPTATGARRAVVLGSITPRP